MRHRLKLVVRNTLRKFGWDMVRYNVYSSYLLSLTRMLAENEVSLVLDVGANEGQYAKSLREGGFRGRIISFEPLPDAHAKLSAFAAGDPLWTVVAATALGDRKGPVAINISENRVSSSVLPILDRCLDAAPKAVYISSETVAMTTLDDVAAAFVTGKERVFLKMDVQGFEREVLEGAKGLLPLILGIQMEASLVPLYEGERCFQQHLEYLSNSGFDLWSLIPGLINESTGRMLQVDGIFFRRAHSCAERMRA
jgi:FkbM family methyltransferase